MRRSIYNPGFHTMLGGYGQRTVYFTYNDDEYWKVYPHGDEGTISLLWVSYLSGNGYLKKDIEDDHKNQVKRFNSELNFR